MISPESCAAIIYRDSGKANLAAEALKLTAPDLLELGLIDGIIPEGQKAPKAIPKQPPCFFAMPSTRRWMSCRALRRNSW